MGIFKPRENPKDPFKNPREPRPKGTQKGVVKRDNGRGPRQGGPREPKKPW